MTDPAIQFDERASRRLLRTYKTPDVVEQRRIVLRALAPEPGERVLDIGSGPGLMAVELAAAVGPDGRVDGIDVSDSMLAIANEQPRKETAAPVTFAAGEALAHPVRRRDLRRGPLHPGVRVRQRHTRRTRASASCVEARRADRDPRYRLGLDRVALERSRAHASAC